MLELPTLVQELAKEVRQLAEAQRRTEQQVSALMQAQHQTEAQLAALAQEVQRFVEEQRQLTDHVARVEYRLQRVEDRLGSLWGHEMERKYRERATAYFGRLLSAVEVLDTQVLGKVADQAVRADRLTWEERLELLWTDVVVRGKNPEGQEVGFALEVSSVIDKNDVERALRRAELCSKTLGIPVYPAVAGEKVSEELAKFCQTRGVWLLLDGHLQPPG